MKLSHHIHPIKQPAKLSLRWSPSLDSRGQTCGGRSRALGHRNDSTVYGRRHKVGVLNLVNYSMTEPEQCRDMAFCGKVSEFAGAETGPRWCYLRVRREAILPKIKPCIHFDFAFTKSDLK